jgi:hypothetical protein
MICYKPLVHFRFILLIDPLQTYSIQVFWNREVTYALLQLYEPNILIYVFVEFGESLKISTDCL